VDDINEDAMCLPVPTDPAYEALFADLALSPVQRRFAEEYVVHGKLAPAAKCARPDTRAPSSKAQHMAGLSLLRQPAVQMAIARLQAYYSAKIGLQTERILGALQVEAFFDPAEIVAPGTVGQLLPLDQWPLAVRQCLKKLKTRSRTDKDGATTVETEVEFSDRQEAKRLLGQHLGLWDKKTSGGGYTLIMHMGPGTDEAPRAPKPVGRLQGPAGLMLDLSPEHHEPE